MCFTRFSSFSIPSTLFSAQSGSVGPYCLLYKGMRGRNQMKKGKKYSTAIFSFNFRIFFSWRIACLFFCIEVGFCDIKVFDISKTIWSIKNFNILIWLKKVSSAIWMLKKYHFFLVFSIYRRTLYSTNVKSGIIEACLSQNIKLCRYSPRLLLEHIKYFLCTTKPIEMLTHIMRYINAIYYYYYYDN